MADDVPTSSKIPSPQCALCVHVGGSASKRRRTTCVELNTHIEEAHHITVDLFPDHRCPICHSDVKPLAGDAFLNTMCTHLSMAHSINTVHRCCVVCALNFTPHRAMLGSRHMARKGKGQLANMVLNGVLRHMTEHTKANERRKHMVVKTPSNVCLTCPRCDVDNQFSLIDDYLEHMKGHTEERRTSMPLYITDVDVMAAKHKKDEQEREEIRESEAAEARWWATEGQKNAPLVNREIAHASRPAVRNSQPPQPLCVYECGECSNVYYDEESLLGHLRSVHDITEFDYTETTSHAS